jgi:ATP-dependent helicase YprA (DUF1998 family)
MPINPVQFAHSVCDEFLRYIFSESPLSDPQMESQAKELLERSSSLDIPLVKGPYVSLSEAFAKGDSIQQMAACGKLHPVMPGLIGFPTMYLHQQQVFEAVQAGCHVLISTGTGSGKTEAFVHPIVDDLLRERDGMVVGSSSVVVGESPALALSAETPAFFESTNRCHQPSSGLTEILVYPMNALANDQLDRLR